MVLRAALQFFTCRTKPGKRAPLFSVRNDASQLAGIEVYLDIEVITMSEHDENPGANAAPNSAQGKSPPTRRSKLRYFLTGTVLLGLGAIGGAATTVAVGANAISGFARMGHHMDDPAKLAERINHRAQWWLEQVDASDQQKRDVGAIITATTTELAPLVGAHRSGKEKMLAALGSDQVDRAAIEAIRQDHLSLADAVSAKLLDSAASVAEIMSLEQRQQLIEAIGEHRHHHGHHRGGWRQGGDGAQ